ncbi:LysE family translocator [Pelagibius sp.]|uniref:LysE family translocator n=1 Tax=Pelagibius sp. TaxID=1931238 RepID=UPI003BAFAD36
MDAWLGPDALSILSAIAAIRIAAWLTPGPNMLVVMNASVVAGRRAGILTGWGVAFGGLLWATLAVAGVSVLFAAVPQVALALRLAGAAYLLWLGFKSFRSALVGSAPSHPNGTVGERPLGWRAFRTGFLVTATNPKAALFYGSILTTFVPVDAPSLLLVAIVLMSGTIGIVTYTITGVFFSAAPIVRFFEAARRPILAAMGALFCGLGTSVAWNALRRA